MLRYQLISPELGPGSDLEHLARWYNDLQIRHFCFPHRDQASYHHRVAPETLKRRIFSRSSQHYRMYVVKWQDRVIAEFSIQIGAHHLRKRAPKSAWIGLIIGDADARGRGLGAKIMRKAESVAQEMGASRVELGVFEFNHRAICLYEKMGYRVFDRVPDKTYWRGRYWSSLCMEKYLTMDLIKPRPDLSVLRLRRGAPSIQTRQTADTNLAQRRG